MYKFKTSVFTFQLYLLLFNNLTITFHEFSFNFIASTKFHSPF